MRSPLSFLYMGSNNSSSRMDDSDSRSRSDEGSDQETDLATILQYLIRRYTYMRISPLLYIDKYTHVVG